MSSSEGSPFQGFQKRSPHIWAWIIILVIVIFTITVRLRLLDIPLERDEGEYAYTAQLILQGVPPYTESYDLKMPGLHLAYAMILAIFGQTGAGIHSGLLAVNLVTILLLFFLGKRLSGIAAGVMASAAYAAMSLSHQVLGFSANAEHLLLVPALGGILLMLRAIESNRTIEFFASGLFLGISFLIKQPALFFILFAGLYLLYI